MKKANNNAKNSTKKSLKTHIILLIIAYIAFIAYLVFEIKNITDIKSSISPLLGSLFILILLLSFTFINKKNQKNSSSIINVGSILIIGYCIINILLLTNIIDLPRDEFVPNFYKQSILEVNEWKEANNIIVKEIYEYSDAVKKDYVISQDVVAPTLTKDIKEITVTISLGPDLEKEVIVPNFIGLKYEEVLKYIEDNHLSNVKIEYQKSEKDPDVVISQSKSGTLKRNSEITITFSKSDDELGDIAIIDLTNKTKLYAVSWLEKYGYKAEIKEEYSDKIDDGYVISQTTNEENPEDNTITLIISKGKRIIAPDIVSMSTDEINKWAIENSIKISYKEEYNDEVKLGNVISSTVNKDELIDKDKTVVITISKGKLEMIKLTTVNAFVNWAENNKIRYDINYENSDTVKKDEIIKCSHNTGDVIKNNDTVVITVSRGKVITIPNFVKMNKTDIANKCSSINLSCSFKYIGLTEGTKKDVAISQSKSAGTKVSEGTGITINLSSGIQEKVTVPNYIGKTKSDISTSCNSIGIKCSFKEVYSPENKKNICIKQSTTGKVNKGSAITITIGKGACSVVVNHEPILQCSGKGDANCTKAFLQNLLSKSCPGIKFKYTFFKENSGIGLLPKDKSDVVVGNNVFDNPDKTYNVVINSN